MANAQRNPFKTRKQVEIGKDDLEWFRKTHGDDAKLSWIINLLFNSYRQVCEKDFKMPLESALMAAQIVKEEIDEDERE